MLKEDKKTKSTENCCFYLISKKTVMPTCTCIVVNSDIQMRVINSRHNRLRQICKLLWMRPD